MQVDTRQSRKKTGTAMSCDIVEYLRTEEALSLEEIGDSLGLSKSFISRVSRGERSFTLEHLRKLETALGEALPILLAKTARLESVPQKLRRQYSLVQSLCRIVLEEQADSSHIGRH